jgi:putative transcriptional regulator
VTPLVAARGRDDRDVFASLRGRLLVATPALGDPNFDRTVVLILEHTPEGAVGVILNRPSLTGLGEAGADWGGWDALAAEPAVVFVGGPVSRTSVICIARSADDDAHGFQPVLGEVGVADLAQPPKGVEAVRLFAGYAGWGEGQLEAEIEAGAWFVLDARPEDPLTPDPEDLWPEVLRRQGGRLAMFALCPLDPSTN